MLGFTYDKQLASKLHTTRDRLEYVCENAADFCEEWEIVDPLRQDKVPRQVIKAKGILRCLQERLLKVLVSKLPALPYNHGGVKGRSIRTNFAVHCRSAFIFKVDITQFYPSVSQHKVFELFKSRFECSSPVAALCTQMCTYKRALAQGLVTSPLLANHVLADVDIRIGTLCQNEGLLYTRFVDDITLSGSFDIFNSGFAKTVVDIIEGNGFTLKEIKTLGGPLNSDLIGTTQDRMAITGICKNANGNWDVQPSYVAELERQLSDAEGLAAGVQLPVGRPYFEKSQIRGRIEFVAGVNKKRGERLRRRYFNVNWKAVDAAAVLYGLMVCKKSLRKSPGN